MSIKILATLGPASLNEDVIKKLSLNGVHLFRINLSHTNLSDVSKVIDKINSWTDVPICLDSEGAQVRNQDMESESVNFSKNSKVKIFHKQVLGDSKKISFTPNTISKQLKGPDHTSSLEPQELNAIVKSIRKIENALGRGKKIVTHSEGINKRHVRKSIVALKEIDKGEIFSEKNITLKKNAKNIYDIINKKNYKFSKRTKDNDELYGSIKPREITKTIESLDKIEIKPFQFDLDKEINKIGSYEAKINLHAEVQAKIHIEVVKQEETN